MGLQTLKISRVNIFVRSKRMNKKYDYVAYLKDILGGVQNVMKQNQGQ